jgi:hypothetical protein
VRDWAELSRLSTVVALDLSYTNFANLGVLEHFTELETLHLRRTAVANLEPLSRLPSLRCAEIYSPPRPPKRFRDGSAGFRGMTLAASPGTLRACPPTRPATCLASTTSRICTSTRSTRCSMVRSA